MDIFKLEPETRLSRAELAVALTQRGFHITKTTLASMATRGNGPPFQKFGKAVIYVWGPSLAWAESRLTPAVTSTSQLRAEPRAA
jgi:hypothetical protein